MATIDSNGTIHVLPIWFLRIGDNICIPTSSHTHKYRNVKARPQASVMVDISREGLNLKGVLIRGKVVLVHGGEARRINRTIHMKYLSPDALSVPSAASYLSKGDDVTLKIHMDRVISWNLADSSAGKATQLGGLYRLLEG